MSTIKSEKEALLKEAINAAYDKDCVYCSGCYHLSAYIGRDSEYNSSITQDLNDDSVSIAEFKKHIID